MMTDQYAGLRADLRRQIAEIATRYRRACEAEAKPLIDLLAGLPPEPRVIVLGDIAIVATAETGVQQ